MHVEDWTIQNSVFPPFWLGNGHFSIVFYAFGRSSCTCYKPKAGQLLSNMLLSFPVSISCPFCYQLGASSTGVRVLVWQSFQEVG